MPEKLESNAVYQEVKFEGLACREMGLEQAEFHECRFVGCDFGEAQFTRCRFTECTFVECDLSLLAVQGSSFAGVRFEGCKIVGVNWTLADWEHSKLGAPPAFDRCAVSHSTFLGLSLRGCTLRHCIAHEVDFREADLGKSDFSGTDLTGSLFMNTILKEADLGSARNYTIGPHQNTLTGARFSLPEALSLLFNLEIQLLEEGD